MSEADLFDEGTQLYLLPGMDFEIFDNIRRLGAPKGKAKYVEEAIGRMQEAIEHTEELRVPSAAKLIALFAHFNHVARRDGLTSCLVAEADI